MGNRVVNYVPVKQGIYKISSTSNGDLGSVLEFEDGRKFVYCLNGTDTLTPGAFIQGPVENANDESVTLQTSIVVGDTTVSVTTGRSYTANELQDGWVQVEDVAAAVIGHARKIKSHPAASSSATMVITVYDAFTDTATAATDTLNLMEHPYNGVMLKNATADGPLLGVAPCDVTAAYYFWLQVAGPASIISGENTMVVGDGLTIDGLTAVDLCNGADDEFVGWAMQSQDTEGNAVMIMLCLGR